MSPDRCKPGVLQAPLGRRLIHLGFSCNNRCVFCSQGDSRRAEEDWTRERLEATLSTIRAEGVREIGFVGGEPTRRDDLPDLVRVARDLGFSSIVVQTNGRRLAYPGYASALAEAGVRGLDVSLQGHNPATHDYHTRVPDSFRQTALGIRQGRRAGLRIGVTSVVTRSNYRHLTELAQLAVSLGAGALHLALVRPEGKALVRLPRVGARYALVLPAVRKALEWAARRRFPVLVSGTPLCVLGGFEAQVLGVGQPPAEMARGHVHESQCEPCGLRELCPGLPVPYRDRFGTGELTTHATPSPAAVTAAAAGHADANSLFCGVGRAAVRTQSPPGA